MRLAPLSRALGAAAASVALGVSSPLGAAPPTGFNVVTVASGLTQPVAHAYAPDGRIFIAEKSGRVLVQQAGYGGARNVALDARANVNDSGERGLLGLALDPAFATRPYVYVMFTRETNPGAPDGGSQAIGEIVRYHAANGNADVLDPASATVLLTGFNVNACCHAVGALAFDRSGRLLASFGDGYENHLTSQDRTLLNGKVIRIDANTGNGVPANPFFDAANVGSVASKILALGFRNPFRISVDPADGAVWVGDVGAGSFEELDRIPPTWGDANHDLNFGWPCYEGPNPYPGALADPSYQAACRPILTPLHGGTGLGASSPTYAYDHSGAPGGSAIIGGPAYRGSLYPSSYVGRVFVADYVRDRVQVVHPTAGVQDFGDGGWGAPVDITSDPSGDISFASIAAGTIRTLVWSGSDHPPLVRLAANPTSGRLPLAVQFTSAGTMDPDSGDVVTYRWAFGDGTTSTLANPTHTYTTPGSYDATLTASDGHPGGIASGSVHVDAGNTAPTVAITSPAAGSLYTTGGRLRFTIVAADTEDGPLPVTAIRWRIERIHLAHMHPMASGTGSFGDIPVDDHGDDPSHLRIVATATDAYGASSEVAIEADPQRVSLRVTGAPTSAVLNLDGENLFAPYAWGSIVGGRHTLIAPPIGDSAKPFRAWSAFGRDVGERVFKFQTPTAGTTFGLGYGARDADARRSPNDAPGDSAASPGARRRNVRLIHAGAVLAGDRITTVVTPRSAGTLSIIIKVRGHVVGACRSIPVRAGARVRCEVRLPALKTTAQPLVVAVLARPGGRAVSIRFAPRRERAGLRHSHSEPWLAWRA